MQKLENSKGRVEKWAFFNTYPSLEVIKLNNLQCVRYYNDYGTAFICCAFIFNYSARQILKGGFIVQSFKFYFIGTYSVVHC